MYILSRTYVPESEKHGDDKYHALLICSGLSDRLSTFKELVDEVFTEINKYSERWTLSRIQPGLDFREKQAKKNYDLIFKSDLIIIECTSGHSTRINSERTSNSVHHSTLEIDREMADIYYMLGVAHALGCPVCQCYQKDRKENQEGIPFNVRGRQNLAYSLNSTDEKKRFKSNLKQWVNHLCL